MTWMRARLAGSLGLLLVGSLRMGLASAAEFPREMVHFVPYRGNPVFAGAGKDTWDRRIRERGYILREGGIYDLWYTGYNHRRSDANYSNTMSVGYATSPDGLKWTRHAVAMNQVVKYRGRYYAYYHACAHRPWRDWTTNVAASTDLIHWKKYPKNPIVAGNRSSGILVHDGRQYRLYIMHPDVRVYFPRAASEGR